ncbi:MAG TPA: zinc-binding dehydrogenase [Candidatus Acidoferrales bacterium]|nr:zinc-binding dehydrogenase [Candidatus Acidoferrales bacterium]
MRTAVIVKPLHVQMQEAAVSEPKGRALRIKLQGCGVCGSNIPLWEGRPWFGYPLSAGAPGHEGWGIVDAVGSEVNDIRPGESVAFLSNHAYAEYDTADRDSVLRLPASLDAMPFPAEPLGCAMNVFRRSGIRAGDRVAIVGIGFLGAVVTRLAVQAGARVAAISRRRFALQVAESLGAERIEALDDPGRARDAVLAWTKQKGCECVVEAVGRQETVDLSTELTCERGRLVIAGYHQDGPRQVNMQLWNWRGLDVINAHERQPRAYLTGMQAAVDAIGSGLLDPLPLLTHVFPLDELSDAFEAARNRPDGFLKALVVP